MLIMKRHQRGVSLIESMIALLVISIGLLGIAAMQVTAMKQNSSAMHHSQAVWIGYDMADRIRANFGQFDNYSSKNTGAVTAKDCSAGCSASDLVTSDVADWSALVQKLPSGYGAISTPVANQLLIQVMWDDEGTGATAKNCNVLTCYEVTIAR